MCIRDSSTVVDQEGGRGRGVESQPVVLNSVYINGTGWASQVITLLMNYEMRGLWIINSAALVLTQLSSGDVWIQYNDGSQLKIQPSGGNTAALEYTNSQGQESRYETSNKSREIPIIRTGMWPWLWVVCVILAGVGFFPTAMARQITFLNTSNPSWSIYQRLSTVLYRNINSTCLPSSML